MYLYISDIFDAISHIKLAGEWQGSAKLTIYWQVLLSKAFSESILYQAFHFSALQPPPRLSFIIHPSHSQLLCTQVALSCLKSNQKNTVQKKKKDKEIHS